MLFPEAIWGYQLRIQSIMAWPWHERYNERDVSNLTSLLLIFLCTHPWLGHHRTARSGSNRIHSFHSMKPVAGNLYCPMRTPPYRTSPPVIRTWGHVPAVQSDVLSLFQNPPLGYLRLGPGAGVPGLCLEKAMLKIRCLKIESQSPIVDFLSDYLTFTLKYFQVYSILLPSEASPVTSPLYDLSVPTGSPKSIYRAVRFPSSFLETTQL